MTDVPITSRSPTSRSSSVDKCGAIVLDDAADVRLSDALRAATGLLKPAEIRAKREALGLKQKELAGYLRINESTLLRWETGAQIQQRSMDACLRIFFELPEARRILGVTSDRQADKVAGTEAEHDRLFAFVGYRHPQPCTHGPTCFVRPGGLRLRFLDPSGLPSDASSSRLYAWSGSRGNGSP